MREARLKGVGEGERRRVHQGGGAMRAGVAGVRRRRASWATGFYRESSGSWRDFKQGRDG